MVLPTKKVKEYFGVKFLQYVENTLTFECEHKDFVPNQILMLMFNQNVEILGDILLSCENLSQFYNIFRAGDDVFINSSNDMIIWLLLNRINCKAFDITLKEFYKTGGLKEKWERKYCPRGESNV